MVSFMVWSLNVCSPGQRRIRRMLVSQCHSGGAGFYRGLGGSVGGGGEGGGGLGGGGPGEGGGGEGGGGEGEGGGGEGGGGLGGCDGGCDGGEEGGTIPTNTSMASRRSSAALALAFAAIISVALPAASAAWRSSMALSSAEHVHVDGDGGADGDWGADGDGGADGGGGNMGGEAVQTAA